jgi:hypothetical protein
VPSRSGQAAHGQGATGSSERRRRSAQPIFDLLLDVGLPMISFYVLRLTGVSQWWALLAATLIASARVGWVALRSRRMTWFGGLMALVYGIGLVMTLVTGDPRLLLANTSLSTAIIGAGFLVSLAFDRPLTLTTYQAWRPQHADAWSGAYASDPLVRLTFRQSAWSWGFGMLGAALLRLPLIYLLPLDAAVAASAVPGTLVIGGLAIWTLAVLRSRISDVRDHAPRPKVAGIPVRGHSSPSCPVTQEVKRPGESGDFLV